MSPLVEPVVYRVDWKLFEETNVGLQEMVFFKEYSGVSFYHPDQITKQRVYVVKINGKPKPAAEIEDFVWLTKKDFKKRKYKMVPITENEIIPDLIKQKKF
ncbi:MAG: hypothetical protein V1664_01895 [Candidatus Uhrbacteria bacterium]